MGAPGLRAQVTRRVTEGAQLTLIVDAQSGSGQFSLDATKVNASCPTYTRDPMNDQAVTRTLAPGDASLLTATCLPTSQSVVPGGTYDRADHSYGITVPAGFGCFVNVESDKPVGLYALEGSACAGPERTCTESEGSTAPYFTDLRIGDPASKTPSNWVVVIESASPNSGTLEYTLSTTCYTF
jgi:hypothetical protein